jgi:Phosphodiester glycosidase
LSSADAGRPRSRTPRPARYRRTPSSSTVRYLPALLLVLMLVTAPGVGPSAAPKVARKKTKEIAAGVVHRVLRRKGPNVIHVIRADLTGRAAVHAALATGELPGLETTSSMARRFGAVAAVNGDFFRPSGRPVASFARDRRLVQTRLVPSANFAVAGDDSGAFIGHKPARVSIYVPATGHFARIARVNSGRPGARQLALFTNPGAKLERAPLNSCSARLMQVGRYAAGKRGAMVAPFRVAKVVCRKRRLLRLGGVVLSARWAGERRSDVVALTKGQRVKLSWSLGWPGIADTVGGNPVLLRDGRIQWGSITGSHPIFRRHPRTGVGVTGDGDVLLVTVDGRKPRHSVGMTLVAFARLFKSIGARWALNLDGGGSTTMWVRGRVVNRPSDGRERRVGSALMVMMGKASTETNVGPVVDAAPITEAEMAAAVRDPASMGGLASWLSSRGRLPAVLAPVAREFDAARRF